MKKPMQTVTHISPVAHAFVATVFVALGCSFIVSTVLLAQEFAGRDWVGMLAAHSHLFVFFPTFGIVALAAFYVPSVVFTDHYWRNVKLGPLRYTAGFVVVLVVAVMVAQSYQSQALRAVWEISPAALASDRPTATGQTCVDASQLEIARTRWTVPPVGQSAADARIPCERVSIIEAFTSLRVAAMGRLSTSEFSRACRPDAMRELPEANVVPRHCFAAAKRLLADDCCRIQQQLAARVAELQRFSTSVSRSAQLDPYFFTAKVFFIFVIVVIGIFLSIWRTALNTYYHPWLGAIDRGVVVGAVAMLFWPIMDYGYQQTTDILFGREHSGFNPRASLILAPWGLLLIFYFMSRLGKDLERFAQIATIVGTLVAIFRYQEINDWGVRLLGMGAHWWHYLIVVLISLGGIGFLIWAYFKLPADDQQKPAA